MRKNYSLFSLLLIIALLAQIGITYSIFETNLNTTTDSTLAPWQILVNDTMVSSGSAEFTVDTVNWTNDSNVLDGKAAPGSSGYFEIIIDPSGSKVAIEYEIELDFEFNNNEYIKLSTIKKQNNDDLVPINSNTFFGEITLLQLESDYIETIRVSFVWENNEDNNDVDSEFINQVNPKIEIPIIVRLKQKI